MKVWTNIKFTGFYPVGVAAVVVAATASQAAELLNNKLEYRCLPRSAEASQFVQMTGVSGKREVALVLCDGNY